MIARVVVDVARDREFDYTVPDALQDSVDVGSRVRVPLGRKVVEGYVVSRPETSPFQRLKPVAGVVGERPMVVPEMLRLAKWMAEYYLAPLEQSIRTVLPSAVRRRGARHREQLSVRLTEQGAAVVTDPASRDGRVSEKQALVIELLRSEGEMFLSHLTRSLEISAAPVRNLEKKGLVSIDTASLMRDPLARRHILPTQPLTLTAEQAVALDAIAECTQNPGVVSADGPPFNRTVLLHGVTGSGKTEVYLQAIAAVREQNRGAIVLVPEISLTPQTVERFVARFGEDIAVLHSHLSDGERHDEWHRIRTGAARIVVGARSAIFAPVRDLGLIVVDEEHEPSYKQDEAPRYHARDVAVMRGHLEGCAVVLGSATPSLESWHNVKRGKYRVAYLRERADNRRMPFMRIVDMRVEAEKSGRVSVFSTDLMEAVRQRLERGEQTILFLNRRGFATSLVCPKCGYVAACDHCSVSFTYHRQREALMCHICGIIRTVPRQCPECGDPAFKYAGIGTQRVETVLRKCFPYAAIERMDSDTTTRKGAYDEMLGDFRSGKTQILLGTQMIAKGLHFPNVTLVGVIYADLSLHMADFRAGERTFQLLAQVAGRAGRGEVPGEVIVQTYTPFHPAIQAARRLDFEGFCDQELAFRRELLYPPFAHLVCMTLRGRSEERVAFTAQTLARELQDAFSDSAMCSEPCPAPLAKAKNYYRYQIMLKSRSVRLLREPLRRVLRRVQLPRDVRCAVDMDAVSLM